MLASLQAWLVAALLGALWWWRLLSRSPGSRYPPGPEPKPFIGNLTDLPSGGYEWKAYVELARKYASDVLYFTVLGTPLLVINSFEAAHELLDKKGSLYSDRPRLVLAKELMHWDWHLLLTPYGKRFTAMRRTIQQEFQPSMVPRLHHQIMVNEVGSLLNRLLATPQVQPDALIDNLRHMTGAIIMMAVYGHQVSSAQDEFVAVAESVREHAEKRPGMALVDVLPILKYLPSWFPGASFKRRASIVHQLSMKMRAGPFRAVKELTASGGGIPCMVTRLLSQAQDSSLQTEGVDPDTFIMDCCGVVYSAGADTTNVAMRNFLLAMMLHPHVQERAQRELDEVVGRERLPGFEDRARLVYTSRLVKESLRWKAVSNLGAPHATLNSDEYRGYQIPKGTTVLANIYAMLHDEAVYANPDDFDPDRYAPTSEKPGGEPDPAQIAFGFGRRVCPGRFFAEASLFLTVASLLHVFTIAIPEGPGAAEAVRNVRYNSGLVRCVVEPLRRPWTMTRRENGADAMTRVLS
ncbi:cytochrome P450 [Pilatotrama ljubarskyi]|nr:cytochrome P450 [Pilatotrama ljubarskyi]